MLKQLLNKYYLWHGKQILKKKYKFSKMILIMGKAGSNKSTYQSSLVQYYTKRGIKCYSSHHVLGAIQFDSKNLGKYDLNNCVFFGDEIQIDFDNRNWKELDSDHKYLISNFRHYNIRLIFSSQSYQDIDVKLKRQAHQIIILQPFIKGLILLQKVRMKFGVDKNTEQDIVTLFKTSIFDYRIKLGFPYWKYFDSFSQRPLPKPNEIYWGHTPPLSVLTDDENFIHC